MQEDVSRVKSPRQSKPIRLFISYSHRDEEYKNELVSHLAPLEREGVRCWHDGLILPGDRWQAEIAANLDSCDAFILLMSPESLNSHHCYDQEFAGAIDRWRARGVRVLPILLRDCDWQGTCLRQFQILAEGHAVALHDSRPRRDAAWTEVTAGIRGALGLPHQAGETDLDVAGFDFARYQEHSRRQYERWRRQYVPLEATPLVVRLGTKLEPIGVPESAVGLSGSQRRLVLLADPGAGKTTTLQFLAQSEHVSTGELPAILVPLSRYRSVVGEDALQRIYALVAESLYKGGATVERVHSPAIGRLLSKQPVCLLLDGLNEVAPEARRECLQGLADLHERHPESRFVVTTRPHGFDPVHFEGWMLATLQPLQAESVRDLIARRLSSGEVAKKLQESATAQAFVRIPLFLRMAIEMAEAGAAAGELRTQSRSGTVAAYLDYLLNWDARKTGQTKSPAESLRLRRALSAIALHLQRVRLQVPEVEIEELLASQSGDSASGTTYSLLLDNGILVIDEGECRFQHHVLQEHLYAGALVDRWRSRRVGVRFWRWWWLKRELASADPAGTAGHMVAHLQSRELVELLPRLARLNPQLAIAWADDLSCEGRTGFDLDSFADRVSQLAVRSSRIGSGMGRLMAAGVACLSTFLVGVFPALGATHLVSSDPDAALGSAMWMTLAVAALVAIWVWARHVPWRVGEQTLNAIPSVHSQELRKRLLETAEKLAASQFIFLGQLKDSALAVLDLDRLGTPVKCLLETGQPLPVIALLGSVSADRVLPVLATITRHDNAFGLAAMRSLSTRLVRFPGEREQICQAVHAVLATSTDAIKRWHGLRILRRAGALQMGPYLGRLMPLALKASAWTILVLAAVAAFTYVATWSQRWLAVVLQQLLPSYTPEWLRDHRLVWLLLVAGSKFLGSDASNQVNPEWSKIRDELLQVHGAD